MNAKRAAGQVEGTVETTGQNTFFGKTAAMLQSVENSGGSLQTLLLQARTPHTHRPRTHDLAQAHLRGANARPLARC